MRKRKSKLIKIICGIVAAASVVSAVPTLYADTLDDLKKKQEELKKEQKDLEKKSKDLKNEKNVTQDEIDELENQLKELLDKINELDRKASELTSKIFETNQKLDKQIAIQEKQYSEMKLRIQYMYENQNSDVAESFVSSDSMADLLNSVEYYQKIYDYDRSKLDEIEATRREIEGLKQKLEEDLEEIKKAEEEMSRRQAEVSELVEQKEDYLASIDSDILLTAQNISSTQDKLDDNASAIAEEEERIRQAELERQRREAAARSSSSSNVSRTASAEGYQSPYAPGTAARVADYARNGISSHPATAGWCAAWVSGVYNMAGVNPPHGNAIDYWNNWSYSGGTGYDVPVGACVISSGAGYLAATYGHIGIYIGNGMVVSNVGGLKYESLESFDASATTTCQGHRGYIGWVWPNGVPLN